MDDPPALNGPVGWVLSKFGEYDLVNESIVEGIAFGIAEVHGFDLRPVNGGHAHGAGLGGTVDYAAGQIRALNAAAGIPDGHDLGMAGGVGILEDTVAGTADDLSIADDDGAERAAAAAEQCLFG